MDPPRQRHHQPDRRVGHLFGAIIGDVGHGNASLAGQGAIDVIDAHATADDQLAAIEPLDRRARQPKAVIQHDRVGVFNLAQKFLFAVTIERRDIGNVAQQSMLGFQTIGNEIGNYNFVFLRHLKSCAKWLSGLRSSMRGRLHAIDDVQERLPAQRDANGVDHAVAELPHGLCTA